MNVSIKVTTDGKYFIVECDCCPRRRVFTTLEAARKDAHTVTVPLWFSGM